ncbi:hypothetical protein OU415_21940 [Saccharopolyspora sp. WRP15-2]|uniref:WXG100 family type VII secretion target n=1 Tax=Saccharopolyspora oryzae TaxID=2997343 RepID=A0ABT4V3V8_9PSEU|nr:hypothetical protein [Saccharopolyspora oryzae]MDA3628111.1 hypothetical protein [Saccharopolyspora oryzae]
MEETDPARTASTRGTDLPATAAVEVEAVVVPVSKPAEHSEVPGGDVPPGEPFSGPPGGDLPPLEPMTATKVVVVEKVVVADGEPAEQVPADPGVPPTEPVTTEPVPLEPHTMPKHFILAKPAEQQEFSALEPAIPAEQGVPAEQFPAEQVPDEPKQPGYALRSPQVVSPHPVLPVEPSQEQAKLEPTVPGQPLEPMRPNEPARLEPTVPATPLQPAAPGIPVTPAQPAVPAQPVEPYGGVVGVPAGAPPTEGATETPMPNQPPPAQDAPPAQQPPPVQQPPVTSQAPDAPPVQNPPSTQPVPNTQNPGGAYNFPTTQGMGGMPSTNGDVGPDPNIKFDEGQYNQLLAVLGDIKSTVRTAPSQGPADLDAELQLQPTGQTWEPATKLVKWGATFGGTVQTENKSLKKALDTLHDSLEKAKEVFKETDDLAAYDASKFTTEYPGFTGGGMSGTA